MNLSHIVGLVLKFLLSATVILIHRVPICVWISV